MPTLVVAGADDTETPPADARLLVAGIPDARLAVVPGTGHLAPVEEPTAVSDLLARHFESAWPDRTPVAVPFAARPRSAVPPRVARARRAAAAGARPVRRGAADPPRGDRRREVESAIARDRDVRRASFDELRHALGLGRDLDPAGPGPAHPQLRRPHRAHRLGQLGELADHTRAALRGGLTPAEIKETLLHTAVYCGLPPPAPRSTPRGR